MHCFVNGKLQELESLSVNLKDFGFARGNTVFELLRVYKCNPFKLDDHINRLIKSLEICCIQTPYSAGDYKHMVKTLIAKNKFEQSVVKFFITQGYPETPTWSLSTTDNFKPNIYIYEEEFKPFSLEYPAHERYYEEGISVASVEAERSIPEAKTIHYTPAVIASTKVFEKGYEDILYINKAGLVTECSRSNVFFVRDGKVITPNMGMLYGVTRKVVLNLCEKLNIPYEERAVHKDELKGMDEVFITGSTVELMPIGNLDGKIYNIAACDIYKTLWNAFKKEILC